MLEKTYRPADFEGRLYELWEKSDGFAGQPGESAPWCVMMPPPNVTGSLHMGHALNNTLQDVLTRYRRKTGRNALWQPGMDHAGDRDADGGRAPVGGGGDGPPCPRPRGVHRAGVVLEGGIGRRDRAPAPPPRRLP